MTTTKSLICGCVLALSACVQVTWADQPAGHRAGRATVAETAAAPQPPAEGAMLAPDPRSASYRLLWIARDGSGFGDKCPAATLTGQNPQLGSGTWQYSDTTFVNPPYGSGRVTCESFPAPGEPNLTTPIGTISWQTAYVGAAPHYAGCVKPHRFEITFYPNLPNPDRPDVLNPAATYLVVPDVARVIGLVNWTGGGRSDRFLLAAMLEPPFDPATVGGRGWFSIASVEAGGECYATLAPAEEGDGSCWRYWLDNPSGGAAQATDVHYCLGQFIAGACCDDWSGECDENGNEFLCDLVGSRFTTGPCSSLDPLCGQIPGACCLANETCLPNKTRGDCENISGAYWRGPQSTCGDCCWIAACPHGAHVEAEACGQDLNGGCRVTPPVFEGLSLHGSPGYYYRTVCGSTWADGGRRDEDWYEFTADQRFEMTIQNVNTQIPIRVTPVFNANYGPPNCNHPWYYYVDTLYEPCVSRPPLSPPLFPRGRYWIHVTPEDVEGPVLNHYPCGTANEYSFKIILDVIPEPDPCNIPGAWVEPENEPDRCSAVQTRLDMFNSGCDKNPPGPMLPITDNFEIWCGKSGYHDLGLCRGDLNCDGHVDFGDINPFIMALANWPLWRATYPDCPEQNADINGDGVVNFADINPFVARLAGPPITCPDEIIPWADTDWYAFEIVNGPKTASFFIYARFPVNWEVYQASAGCGAPALERRRIVPYLSASKKTFCLPTGTYWLRVFPDAGVECGEEYALGLEEFAPCSFCSVTCPMPTVPEAEPCGEDTNGGCNTTPHVFEAIACNTTICATTWANDGTRDTDWFELTLTAPRYLIFTVQSEVPVLTGFMDTSVANCSYLFGYWINVEDCTAEPSSWYFVNQQQQPVQFDPGTYWWTVFPDDGEDPLFYSYPCNRPAPFDLNTYWFQIECRTTPPQSVVGLATQKSVAPASCRAERALTATRTQGDAQ